MAGKRASDVDGHVGRRVRERRREIGMSQGKLGSALGITSQQIQKYEAAIDRVAVSRLWGMARALEVDVDYFFEGIKKRTKRKAKPRRSTTAAKAKRTTPRKRRN